MVLNVSMCVAQILVVTVRDVPHLLRETVRLEILGVGVRFHGSSEKLRGRDSDHVSIQRVCKIELYY